MMKVILEKYANITTEAVALFKSLCIECMKKRKRVATKGVVVKPILTSEYGSRGQVDLIDMQSMPSGQYKWIMVYQDHLTKFCILRPLSTKRAAEVAYQLIDIFLLMGAPHILQSDNGAEFTASVINELKSLWPELLIVHGKPRHPQSQGSVERLNCDIKDILIAWLGDNNSVDWSAGLKFVQFSKNVSHHSGIKQSPYQALFVCTPRVGLRSTHLPEEVLRLMVSEDDLFNALHTTDTIESNDPAATTSSSSINQSTDPAATTTSSSINQSSDPSTSSIQPCRKKAREALQEQAQRMVKRSRIINKPGDPGDNVTIPIPLVDRGRGDARNIMGVIIDRNENDLYRIAVHAGILQGMYARNQFELCTQKLLTFDDVCQAQEISLRSAVSQTSKSGGQGYMKCNCSGVGKNKCQSKKCKCFKNNLKCNSRCHGSLCCANKI